MWKNEARQGLQSKYAASPPVVHHAVSVRLKGAHVCIISHTLAGVWQRTVLRVHSSDVIDHVYARPRPTCFDKFIEGVYVIIR